jgi:hypothetical protein
MMTDMERESDALILPYLQARDDEEARRLLGELVSQQADPIIKGVIARQTRTDAGRRAAAGRRQEAEAIQGETVVQLVTRLEALRGGDGSECDAPIADLRGYVAGLALQNCESWLRRRFPRRARLRNRLRYLLGHDARFRLQAEAGEGWLCGLAGRDRGSLRNDGGQGLPAESPATGGPTGSSESAPARAGSQEPSPSELATLALDLLARAGRPVSLDFLVDAVARSCGLDEAPERRPTGGNDSDQAAPRTQSARAVPEPSRDPRDQARRIWEAILALPPLQRSVLLLNLRDASGHGLVGVFPVTGIAGIRRIAIAIGMLPERFAELWKDLPLDDGSIATRLRLSRSQVLELRQAARRRLARRIIK